jgi:hypothetical protein
LPQKIVGLAHDVLMGRAADTCYVTIREKEIITVAMKVQAMAGDGMLRYGAQASNSVGPDFKRFQVPRSQAPARGCRAAPSRFGPEAGMSQDGRPNSLGLDLKIDNLQAGREILGFRRMRINFGEE